MTAAAARARARPPPRSALEAFLDGPVDAYADERDRPDHDGTSRLSPHLRFGTLHPRQVLDRCRPGTSGDTFRSELAWREFYADVLWHRPDSAWSSLSPVGDHLRWDTGPEADRRFAAWAAGRTGFPLVDAGMRQLAAEGWMHNRVRMLTASFLVKDLHLDWRRGARPLPRPPGRRRPRLQQPRLAVGGGHRHRRGPVPPCLQSGPAGRALRPRRRLRRPVRARARDARLSGADRRPRRRAAARPWSGGRRPRRRPPWPGTDDAARGAVRRSASTSTSVLPRTGATTAPSPPTPTGTT